MERHQDLLGYRFNAYNILKQLGSGQFSRVYEAYNDQDNTTVAIKAIPTSLFSNKKIKQLAQTEIKIMKSLKYNPNIIRFIDNFKNKSTVFIVMQLCDKGTLQQLIDSKKGLSQDDAKEILIQLINGFKGLHEFNIIHRDFKAANIMIKGDKYKIADFGFAKMLQNKSHVTMSSLGTAVTQAPEIYKSEPYGMEADIWSLGVVFYQMIYKKYPYYGITQQIIFQQSKQLPSFKGANISEKAKDFISRCLTQDPKKRITWAEIYEHPLLNQRQQLRQFGSLQSDNYFRINKLYYIKQLKPKVKDYKLEQNISQMEIKEGRKMEILDLEKVKKQNDLKKKMETAINQYKDIYMNHRNKIAFVMKYLFPNACYIQKLQIKHADYLFTLCKCTYKKLKQLEIQTKDRVNFLGLKEFYDEFTKSANYKQLIQIFTNDAELVYLQTQVYNQSFDMKEIKNVNVEEQMKSAAFEYQNLLTDGLDFIKKEFPRQKLIIMIQTLDYLRQDKCKQNYQNFENYIQTLDFNQVVQLIRDKQIQQLSHLYS